MATYYAHAGSTSDNWSNATRLWATSSKGTTWGGPPTTGDTAIIEDDFDKTITIAAGASCLTLTVQAGATGTLAWGGAYVLTMGTGTVTFVSTFHLTGTSGTLRLNAVTCTLTTGGLHIPGHLRLGNSSQTLTLGDDLIVDGILMLDASSTPAGTVRNITCGGLDLIGTSTTFIVALTFKIGAGKTLTVGSGGLRLVGLPLLGVLSGSIVSATASSTCYLVYSGAAANCKVSGMTFTDVDASGSAQPIINWNGGTLLRCAGIYNMTQTVSAGNMPAVAAVRATTTFGGVDESSNAQYTGTIATRTLSTANDTVAAGYYAATTLHAEDADLAAANIVSGKTIFGFAGEAAGGAGGLLTHPGMAGGMRG